jgi:hypothetical protein
MHICVLLWPRVFLLLPVRDEIQCYSRKQKYSGKGNFILEQTKQAQEGSRYSPTLSLNSAVDVVSGQRHAPAALTPGKRPDNLCTEGWVSPKAELDG